MSELFKELLSVRLFKASQGKLTRRLTMVGIALLFLTGAYTLFLHTDFWGLGLRGGIAGAIAAFGCWAAFRAVNYPPFADFLVAVEAEMMKVSWPSKHELYISTIVVLVVLALLAVLVYVFDILWYAIFHFIFQII